MVFFTGLNYWAILVAAVACMVIGTIWMRASGITKNQGMAGAYIGMFVGSLILSAVLAHFVVWMDIITWMNGLLLGVVAWLGFVATAFLGGTLFEKRSWTWYNVTVGYYLVQMAVIGAIIGGWR